MKITINPTYYFLVMSVWSALCAIVAIYRDPPRLSTKKPYALIFASIVIGPFLPLVTLIFYPTLLAETWSKENRRF